MLEVGVASGLGDLLARAVRSPVGIRLGAVAGGLLLASLVLLGFTLFVSLSWALGNGALGPVWDDISESTCAIRIHPA